MHMYIWLQYTSLRVYCVCIYYTLFIFNLSYCLYACNNFLHVNFMLLINKHTKEDFFYVPSTVTYTTHPRHKLAQASKFHLLVTFLNFLKLIHVLIPLPPCWLHLKHFYAYLPFTFNFFLQTSKSSPTLHYYRHAVMYYSLVPLRWSQSKPCINT